MISNSIVWTISETRQIGLRDAVKRRVLHELTRWNLVSRTKTVPLDRLLMGDESGMEASKICWLFDEPLRASRPIAQSPHARLLRQYQAIGDRVFEPDIFNHTEYYENALHNINLFGRYFEAVSENDVSRLARRFIAFYRNDGPLGNEPLQGSHTAPGDPVRVRPIRHSDCYQVVDGHHRLAIAHARGDNDFNVYVELDSVLTPLQSLLLQGSWLQGRHELYQPVEAPELERSWALVRRCTDRLAKIRQFLDDEGLAPPSLKTYLDIGSCYGWFVAEMGKLGFLAQGVDRDVAAIAVGPIVYGIDPSQIVRADCARFLLRNQNRYDVVSCFSVLHHFVLGLGSVTPEEFIRRVDGATGRVLFFDTGQGHEAWFKDRLAEWTTDYIERWLEANTSFTRIIRLGPDEDAMPPFEKNYSRMLFACLR